MKKFLSILLILVISATSISTSVVAEGVEANVAEGAAVAGTASANVDSKISNTINFIVKDSGASSAQDLLDNIYANAADEGGEWVVIALRQYLAGGLDYSKYREALENVAEEKSSTVATTRLRYSLTLQAVGSTSTYMDETLSDAPGEMGIMSYVFGLHIASNGATSDKWNAESLIDNIISLENEDGGWSVAGDSSDVDVTAMTLQALALYKGEERVDAAIDKGLKLLQDRQLDSGSFGTEGNESVESNAQVLVCLSSLGIDAASDERFIKNGKSVLDGISLFEIGDGSYSHTLEGEADMIATKQALYSLVSYTLLESGETLYHFTSDIDVARHEGVLTGDAQGTSDIDEKSGASAGTISTRLVAYIIIAIIFVIWCVVLFITKKRNVKYFALPLVIAGVAVLITSLVNFSSAENYYGSSDEVTGEKISVTISIDCDTIKDSNALKNSEKDYIPVDGVVLPKTTIEVAEGATVYDVLVSACKKYSIQMESEGTSADAYIAGIAYIYEYDFGELSGWMYEVNGDFADVGCASKKVNDGDEIGWHYTTDLGKDIGDNSMS